MIIGSGSIDVVFDRDFLFLLQASEIVRDHLIGDTS